MAEDIANRPEKVSIALKLLYLTFGVGVVRGFSLIETYYDTRTGDSAEKMIAAYAVLLFMCLCVYLTGKKRGWARFIAILLGAASAPFSIFKDFNMFAIDPIFSMFGFGQVIFVVIAAFVLFQRESNEWFRG